MDEKNLFKIALLCSLTGILIILLISDNLEVPIIKVYEINRDLIDKQIKTSGKINQLRYMPGIVIFNIKDETGEIKVITFEEDVDLKNNQEILIEGTIKEYKNYLEIEAKQIRLI